MKTSQLLGFILIIIEVSSIVLFLTCGYTIYSILGTLTHGGGEIPIKIDENTQKATLTFTFTPRNSGYIAANLEVGFGVTLKDNSYSIQNKTSIYLQPGAQKDVSLTIKVPVDKLIEYTNEKGTLDIFTSIRTLNDLVRLDYKAKMEGGV